MTQIPQFRRFIDGLANEADAAVCQQYLEDRTSAELDLDSHEMVGDLSSSHDGDAILTSLMAAAETTVDAPEECRELSQRIQRNIRHRFNLEEIRPFIAPPQGEDEIGRIGPYRVLEEIGSGGMGIVFLAENEKTKQQVALKLMNPLLAASPEATQRFQREAQQAARLNHRRIVEILDVGEHGGIPYYAMPRLKGLSLAEYLQQNGAMRPAQVKKIAIQIADALDYAYEQGVLHRDIKPSNLWLDDDGDIVILDFGLARAVDDSAGLTKTGELLGTPRYMAPELLQGESADHRSDLFSLGAVMFEMLTGKPKFAENNLYSTMLAVTQRDVSPDELIRANCPPQMADLVCQLLAKSPDDRLASAAVVRRELPQIGLSEDIALATNDHLRRSKLRSFIIGFAASSLLFLLAIVVYYATDRGTLVIEAAEGVEITTQSGAVQIRLIDSETTYDVRIGPNRLPSGAYEVVVTDESRELSFSSDHFVIRRGGQRLVQVSVRGDAKKESAYSSMLSVLATYDPVEYFFLGKIQNTDGRRFEFVLGATGARTESGTYSIDTGSFQQPFETIAGWEVDVFRDGEFIESAVLEFAQNKGEFNDRDTFVANFQEPDGESVFQVGDMVVIPIDVAGQPAQPPQITQPTQPNDK